MTEGADAGDAALDEIAAELYVLPPGEFTTARNAHASDAKGPLAAQIKALRKPLLAAWIVNVFAHENADELGQALELGEQLREAQAELDAATLTQLGRQRRALVRSLAKKAADLATERGEKVTPSTAQSVEETLNAALFDPDAAAAVASGRLMRPLEAGGIGSVDLSDAVAGTPPVARVAAEAPTDELQARRARKQAERAVQEAEQAVRRAQRDLEDLDRRERSLGERTENLAAREAELKKELEQIRGESQKLAAEQAGLDKRRSGAEKQLADAEASLGAAKQALGDS